MEEPELTNREQAQDSVQTLRNVGAISTRLQPSFDPTKSGKMDMQSNMMVYVLLHSVVQIIAILPEIRYVLSIPDSREVLIIRRHMFECNLTVNCHIINSTLYPIQQLNRWLTRLDSTSCLACRTPREVGAKKRRRRGDGKERKHGRELSITFICIRVPMHPCIVSLLDPKIELDMPNTQLTIPLTQLMLNGFLLSTPIHHSPSTRSFSKVPAILRGDPAANDPGRRCRSP